MALAGAEKSCSKLFFVVSQIFILLSLYALVDEAVVRRPWKHFQQESNQLEMQLAEREYQDILSQYKNDKTGEKIEKLELELENAVVARESDKFEKLTDALAKLQIKYDDDELEIKFNKSILDNYYYEYKHALQTGHDYEVKKKRYFDLEKKIKDAQEKLKISGQGLKVFKDKIAVYDNKVVELEKKIAALKLPIEQALKKIQNISLRQNEIQQIVVANYGIQGNIYWGRVDRCQTCHTGVDKDGLEDVVQAYQLQVVPDEKARAEAVKKDPANKGFYVTESQKKYLQTMYGTHTKRAELFGKHPIATFGCTSCHGGDGRALNIGGLKFGGDSVHKVSEGSGGSHGNSHEETVSSSGYVQGVFGPDDKTHATHHHAIEPLLRGKQMESNCLGCHNGQINVPGAATLTKGISLFVDLGCHGCHMVKGYENLHKIGPGLNKIAYKVKKEWIVDWIKNPKEYMPNSRMPHFNLNDDEVVAVSSFLLSNSRNFEHNLKHQLGISGSAQNGKALFETIGCQGCHSADDSRETFSERSRASNLSRLASKITSAEWVYDWIKEPNNFSPHARMPDFRLTDQEAADITAYLMALSPNDKMKMEDRSGDLAGLVNIEDEKLIASGKKIIENRGCYACHDIKGFEGFDKIGPELTALALKENFEFDFGDALAEHTTFKDEFGSLVSVTHNPETAGQSASELNKINGNNRQTNLVESWQAWVRNKLRYPTTIFKHERAELKMPNFNLSDDELDSLLSFLRGLQKKEVPLAFDSSSQPFMNDVIVGQRLVAEYNCQGCHSISGFGGEINADIAKNVGADTPQFYPPSLEHVGEKVRTEWLHRFLKNPTVYRPALKVRMPSFSVEENEINTLIRYFAGLSKVNYKLTVPKYTGSAENMGAAKVLASPEAYNCFSCHWLHGKKPGEDSTNWAPDFANMKERVQHDFFVKWIKNPAAYQKFAVMPGFLNSDAEAHPDYLGGKADKQLEALRDYILYQGDF